MTSGQIKLKTLLGTVYRVGRESGVVEGVEVDDGEGRREKMGWVEIAKG